MEYQFARFQNTACDVVEKCNAYNLLCKVENENIAIDFKIQNVCFLIFYL